MDTLLVDALPGEATRTLRSVLCTAIAVPQVSTGFHGFPRVSTETSIAVIAVIEVVIEVMEVPWKSRGNPMGLIEVKWAAPQLPESKNPVFSNKLIEVRLPQLLVIN